MAKTKVSVKGLTAKLEALRTPIDTNSARLAGLAARDELKRLVASGQSSIKGEGRFEGYRGSYLERIKRGGYKSEGKSVRPVNLKLSGDFLESLKVVLEKDSDGNVTPSLGFTDQLSIDKEEGHRTGANGQAKRPIIPVSGEEWSTSIKKIVADVYRGRIRKLAKDLSKK